MGWSLAEVPKFSSPLYSLGVLMASSLPLFSGFGVDLMELSIFESTNLPLINNIVVLYKQSQTNTLTLFSLFIALLIFPLPLDFLNFFYPPFFTLTFGILLKDSIKPAIKIIEDCASKS